MGDTGLKIEFGSGGESANLSEALAMADALASDPPPGMVEVVPAFGSVTLYYDPVKVPDFEAWFALIEQRVRKPGRHAGKNAREVVIPVCYAPEHAPDLDRVAAQAELAPGKVAELHGRADYQVAAVGFTPGFPYLTGLPKKLHTPRLATPRVAVPAGSVGIGGPYTGIYPMASPGGWNLIGRTPLELFRANDAAPALLRVGDRVKFRAISPEEFATWK
jgi:inhibitor of KinA